MTYRLCEAENYDIFFIIVSYKQLGYSSSGITLSSKLCSGVTVLLLSPYIYHKHQQTIF